jgi:hypothetical protein
VRMQDLHQGFIMRALALSGMQCKKNMQLDRGGQLQQLLAQPLLQVVYIARDIALIRTLILTIGGSNGARDF